jgi:hypothetical protein
MGMVVVACIAARIAGMVELTLGIAVYQDEVLPLYIAQLVEPLEKRRVQVRFVGPHAPI